MAAERVAGIRAALIGRTRIDPSLAERLNVITRESRQQAVSQPGFPDVGGIGNNHDLNGTWADTADGELLERLSRATGAMMFIVNLTPQTLWVNDALVATTGYSFDDYYFQRFENPFIPAEDTVRVVEALGQFLASEDGVSEVIRNRFIDRWGGTLHVRSHITKIMWKGERALLYTTFQESPATSEATETEQHYRSLVESATDAIVRLAPDLTLQYSNRCFQDLVGHKPLLLNTLKFTDLVVEEHREAVRKQLGADQDRLAISAPISRAGGTAAWVEGTFVRTKRGPGAGLLQAILRDTTERRQLDARIQQAQKRETLGQLAGGIAHDLNNILTGVLGSVTLAEDAIRQGRPAGGALADIRLAAQRAGQLSSSMLAYAGEGNMQRVPIDLRPLVAEMRPLLSSALSRNVELKVSTSTERVEVLGDEIQLRQVVMNLVVNAADASRPAGGVVAVQAGVRPLDAAPVGALTFGDPPPMGPVAFVRVEDQGQGMPPEVVARIFDPFFSTKAKGRGLGLAAVLGILGRHAGCVRVRSVVGVGTEVEILLPLSQTLTPTLPQASPPAAVALARGSASILVVDDEAIIRSVSRRAFESVGYDVLEAATGEEALVVLREHPDVRAVVLDQTMPGMGGAAALILIRETYPTLAVVRTSGYSADSGQLANDPRTCFLGKPYGTHELLAVVQKVIGQE